MRQYYSKFIWLKRIQNENIALLRGINVGRSGKLPMEELRLICDRIGFKNVSTYIQSGNVIFKSKLTEPVLKEKLEQALMEKMQKQVPVIIRTAKEMKPVVYSNPFPDANPSQVGIMFFAEPFQQELFQDIVIPGREEIRLSSREIYIHYQDGIGRSKLKIPMGKQGTMRNLNTVSRLAGIEKNEIRDKMVGKIWVCKM